MKFITETVESVEYLVEAATENSPKQYFIEGIFMQGDVKNKNGRIYPTKTLIKEAERYTKTKINERQSLGELNHPAHLQVNPERASHIITKLWCEGNNIMGRAKVLDTPMGKIVKTLMDEGVKLGVSSRGAATMTKTGGAKYVGEDFYLSAVDIVSDPSAPNAFVESIMESKEFAVVDGVITEVSDTSKLAKRVGLLLEDDGALNEAALLEKFSKLLNK